MNVVQSYNRTYHQWWTISACMFSLYREQMPLVDGNILSHKANMYCHHPNKSQNKTCIIYMKQQTLK